MKNKQVSPSQFADLFFKHEGYEKSRIYHRNGLWEAHCPVGILSKPDGEIGFADLQGLLSILAGVGIRRMEIEWDGLPEWNFPSDGNRV